MWVPDITFFLLGFARTLTTLLQFGELIGKSRPKPRRDTLVEYNPHPFTLPITPPGDNVTTS